VAIPLSRIVIASRPTVVYHADWGTDPKKRWLCKAVLEGDRYRAHAPVLVGDHFGLLNPAKNEIGETGTAVIGFDFPIGIPARYAALLGITDFKSFLLQLGHGDFAVFYRIFTRSSEVSKYRPTGRVRQTSLSILTFVAPSKTGSQMMMRSTRP
jgi:hypothetical protein